MFWALSFIQKTVIWANLSLMLHVNFASTNVYILGLYKIYIPRKFGEKWLRRSKNIYLEIPKINVLRKSSI